MKRLTPKSYLKSFLGASKSNKTSANLSVRDYFRQFSDWWETYFGHSQESPGMYNLNTNSCKQYPPKKIYTLFCVLFLCIPILYLPLATCVRIILHCASLITPDFAKPGKFRVMFLANPLAKALMDSQQC